MLWTDTLKHFGRRQFFFGRSFRKRKLICTVIKSYCNNTQCISESRGLHFHNLLSVSVLTTFFIIIDFFLEMFLILCYRVQYSFFLPWQKYRNLHSSWSAADHIHWLKCCSYTIAEISSRMWVYNTVHSISDSTVTL